MQKLAILIALSATVVGGCGSDEPAIKGCVEVDNIQPFCHFSNPEDLELLPDGHTLIVSQAGDIDGRRPGSLALFDSRDESITRLPVFIREAEQNWGSPNCPGAPGERFSPHGIHLSQRDDDTLQLLVVNHGGRESVEYFEVSEAASSWSLNWRGCVEGPAGSFFNDVTALPQGGFLVTHMFPKSNPRVGAIGIEPLKAALGMKTGSVLHWDGSRYDEMKGSKSPFPNGIAVNSTGDSVFLNSYMGDEVLKISFPEGELLGSASIRRPDNSHWTATGELLIASQNAPSLDTLACFDPEPDTEACGAAFDIVRLNPDTMAATSVFSHHGAPMGAASVAIEVEDALYLGSFTGNRIVKVRPAVVPATAPPAD